MEIICEHSRCVGCSACVNNCPTKSISMKEDELGFIYPSIDQLSCINCGLCKKVCPTIGENTKNMPNKVYAAINQDKNDYVTTTSGGIATLFSKKIISLGGSVYGAAICGGLKVKHIRVTKLEEVERLKGSKYVQSMIGNCYEKVKKDLLNNMTVLFIGTPCQVAGLKKYLQKNYEKLYLCDIVCHGVPADKLLVEHIFSVTGKKNVTKFTFRDSMGFFLRVFYDQIELYRKKNFYDLYYLGFLKGLFYRECCYECEFAETRRIGDITLGDFWGFDRNKGNFPVETKNGLSLVMINTEAGKHLLEICKENLILQERELEEAVNGNKQLRRPSTKHRNYDKFKKLYKKKGFERATGRLLWKERIVYAFVDKIGR